MSIRSFRIDLNRHRSDLSVSDRCLIEVDPRVFHYSDVKMREMASRITGISVCSTVCSGVNKRKQQSFASLAFVRGIHRSTVDVPHKRPVTRKMFRFDDVIMSRPGECVANDLPDLSVTPPAQQLCLWDHPQQNTHVTSVSDPAARDPPTNGRSGINMNHIWKNTN